MADPVVRTDPATGIGSTSATLNGTLVSCDNPNWRSCQFLWSEGEVPGHETDKQVIYAGNSFSQLLTGLDPNTLHSFRAKVPEIF